MGNAIVCCSKGESSEDHQKEPTRHHDHHYYGMKNKGHGDEVPLPFKAKPMQNQEMVVDKEGVEDHRDAYDDFLHRAKIKIRTTSNVDGDKVDAFQAGNYAGDQKIKEDNVSKDVFSDYINRAKVRIRKIPSIGSSKK